MIDSDKCIVYPYPIISCYCIWNHQSMSFFYYSNWMPHTGVSISCWLNCWDGVLLLFSIFWRESGLTGCGSVLLILSTIFGLGGNVSSLYLWLHLELLGKVGWIECWVCTAHRWGWGGRLIFPRRGRLFSSDPQLPSERSHDANSYEPKDFGQIRTLKVDKQIVF